MDVQTDISMSHVKFIQGGWMDSHPRLVKINIDGIQLPWGRKTWLQLYMNFIHIHKYFTKLWLYESIILI